jgi:hypothetical protein
VIDIEPTGIGGPVTVVQGAPPTAHDLTAGYLTADTLIDRHFLASRATITIKVGPVIEEIAVVSAHAFRRYR